MLEGRKPVRDIYMTAHVTDWLRDTMPSLDPDGYYEGALSPKLQILDTFRRFIGGEPLNDLPPKTLKSHPQWIHEIRTHDIRTFGWFYRSDKFIASRIDRKERFSKREVTYSGYIELCCRDREILDLDEPKFIEGEIDDILQY